MSEEKKELTLDEMKNLISLGALLPSLLEKIESINRRVDKLSQETTKLINHYNENTKSLMLYKESIDDLVKNMINSKEIKKELDEIKTILLKNNTINNVEIKETKKKEPSNVKKEKIQTEEDDEVIRIVDLILKDDNRGRNSRTLTIQNVKNGFKADNETAQKVLDYLEKKKYYDPTTKILKFPKKN